MKPSKELANAAGAGDLKKVQAMVKADPALAKEWQPMMDACFFGQVEVVEFLLDHGADPNVLSKSAHYYRPLHRVVERKVTVPRGPRHLETVKLLLARGADPMLLGAPQKMTAIAVAARGGEVQFLPLLLEKAPKSHDIFTAAVLADAPRVKALLKADPKLALAEDEAGKTALEHSIATRVDAVEAKLEIAELLLKNGASAAGLLDRACWENSPLVDVLIAHGGQIENDDTINHAACDGHFDLLEKLIANGATLRGTRGTEHHGGYWPIGCAVSMRSVQGVKWFLDHGESPNEIGSTTGETALHVAARWGAAEPLLKLLIDSGVNTAKKDTEGRTALDVALAAGKTKTAEYLRANC
jgi:ankyrin repeat protein